MQTEKKVVVKKSEPINVGNSKSENKFSEKSTFFLNLFFTQVFIVV